MGNALKPVWESIIRMSIINPSEHCSWYMDGKSIRHSDIQILLMYEYGTPEWEFTWEMI